MRDKKQLILKYLRNYGRSCISKIAVSIHSNTWHILKYLDELEKENLIKKEKETNSTYWSLK